MKNAKRRKKMHHCLLTSSYCAGRTLAGSGGLNANIRMHVSWPSCISYTYKMKAQQNSFPDIRSLLQEQGYCVVPSVLSSHKATKYKRLLKATCRRAGEDVAHSEQMWRLRTEGAVRAVFQEVWGGEKDLISSFEGVTWKQRGGKGLELGYHVDQQLPPEEGKQCVQAIIALTPSGEERGGTALLPRSHVEYASVLKRNSAPKRRGWQFFNVDDRDPVFKRCPPPVQPLLNAGDMLLWDSRLVHKVPSAKNERKERVVAYVCMTPRKFASRSCIRRRRDAYMKQESSTHWPHIFVRRGKNESLGNDAASHNEQRKDLI